MAEEKKNEEVKAKKIDMAKIVGLVIAVVNLAVGGAGLFLTYKGTLGYENPKITEAELERQIASEAPADLVGPFIYTMDKFTVNLGGEPKKTIRLEVNLEMLDQEGFEEIISTENRARTRDKIVEILNEKTFSDIETMQGKLFLKEKIALEVNKIIPKGVVKDIFFSDFVVQ